MLGNEEDFSAALGFEVAGLDEPISPTSKWTSFKQMIDKVVKDFPFQSRRDHPAQSENRHPQRLGRDLLQRRHFLQAKDRKDLEIYDRVGGGDSFASGLIYGFLAGKGPQWAVECGAAHGALAMTTPGDTSMVTLKEVTRVMEDKGARIAR